MRADIEGGEAPGEISQGAEGSVRWGSGSDKMVLERVAIVGRRQR